MRSIGAGIVMIILCAAAATSRSTQALAEPDHDYWFLGASVDEMTLHYIDSDSIVSPNGGLMQAWTTALTSNSAPQSVDRYVVALREVNCQTRRVRALRSAVYHRRDDYEVPMLKDEPDAWTYAAHGSFGEAELEFMCRGATARTSLGVPLPKGVTLEQHAVSIFEAMK